MEKSFRNRIASNELLVGTVLSLQSPEVAELLVSCGFDWFFIDMEHGAYDMSCAQSMVMAASPDVPCLIRVPSLSEVWIKKCLDLGSAGIIVPQLRTREDAERAVRWSKFPPQGERSVGIARAHGYGMNFQNYVDNANNEVVLALQVEHIDAVNNLDAILSVPGFEAVIIGPYDLSGSMGKIGQVNDKEVKGAIDYVKKSCQDAGKPVGIFGASSEAVKGYIEEGYKLVIAGMDMMLLGNAAQKMLAELKQ